jgi:hypothetical protein
MFEISEKYKKYLLKLQLVSGSKLAVWGENEEGEDVFLISNGKLLCFNNLNSFRKHLSEYKYDFFDKDNFIDWLSEEDLDTVYATLPMNLLVNSNMQDFQKKDKALELLSTIGSIEDYAIQANVSSLLDIFNNTEFKRFKDSLYDNSIWVTEASAILFPKDRTENMLKDLYNEFEKNIQIVLE